MEVGTLLSVSCFSAAIGLIIVCALGPTKQFSHSIIGRLYRAAYAWPSSTGRLLVRSALGEGAAVTFDRFLIYIQFDQNPLFQILYVLFYIICTSCYYIFYVPLLQQWELLPPVKEILMNLWLGACVFSFVVASTTDPGTIYTREIADRVDKFFSGKRSRTSSDQSSALNASAERPVPGASKTVSRFAAKPIHVETASSESREQPGSDAVSDNYCSVCKWERPARSKHCKICKACVAQFDHHCVWINSCVGYNNHRFFILFLAINGSANVYGMIVSMELLWKIAAVEKLWGSSFIYSDGSVVTGSWFVVLQYLFYEHRLVFLIGLFAGVAGLTLLFFAFYHVLLVSMGVTSYEQARTRRTVGAGRSSTDSRNVSLAGKVSTVVQRWCDMCFPQWDSICSGV